MKTATVLLSLFVSSAACAFGRAHLTVDPVTPSSILSGDATGLAEGCGQQPSTLGMFCRQVEGDASNKSVWFIGPPSDCDREACVYVKVFNGQGAVAWGGSIPKGKTRVEVAWKTLLASDTFQVGYRGLWSFNTTVYWKDADGREHESVSQGDIVLRVYKTGYVPLHTVENDPSYAWTWTEGSYLYKVTTGLRAFVKKVK